MLQVFATKSLGAAKHAASSSAVARGSSKKVANARLASVRPVSVSSLALSQTQMRIAYMKYSSEVNKAEGDQEHVWEDLNNVNDFYDPRWDSDIPEEEGFGGLFDNMSDEEYARLLGLVRGAQGGEHRFPPGAYQKNEMIAAQALAAASKATVAPTSTVSNAAKANSLEGHSALTRLRLGTLRLPEDLLERIRLVLKDYPRAWLKRDAEALSDALRARTVEQVTGRRLRRIERRTGRMEESQAQQIRIDAPPIEYNKHQAMAYAALRIPGIFSCNTKVFDEIKKRFPGFSPRRMMDFGSGPGTTTWAASQMWPSIKRYQLVEPSESMVNISFKLLEDFPVDRRPFLHQGKTDRFDLIVASYSLSELSDDASRRLHVLSMWEHLDPGGLLIVVEPGTPIGFKVVRQIRSTLMELADTSKNAETKPTIVGPCPHAHRCPMSQTTWCHFIQRVERSATLRSTKSAVQNWENEKFSYMAISKGPLPGELELADDHPNKDSKWSRLVRQPLKRGGHIVMDSCLPSGTVERITVSRKHGQDLYTAARKATWGDLFYVDHVVDAEAAIESHPRRKWAERAADARQTRKETASNPAENIIESELEKLGLHK